MSISDHCSATMSPAPQLSAIMTPSTSGNTTRGVSGNIIVIYIIYLTVFMLLNQVRKLNLTLQQYTMYCYVVDMQEIQLHNILNYVKKITVQVK